MKAWIIIYWLSYLYDTDFIKEFMGYNAIIQVLLMFSSLFVLYIQYVWKKFDMSVVSKKYIIEGD